MAIAQLAPVDPPSREVRELVARFFGAEPEPRLDVVSDPETSDPPDAIVVIPTSLPPAEANARLDELLNAADGLDVVFDVAYA